MAHKISSMEFGKVSASEIDSVNFSLPPDGVYTQKVLTGNPVAKPKVYVGGAKWGRKEWIGVIYPEKTKETAFLEHYARHFNSIELNATHYKIYPESTIAKWAAKTGNRDFKFCPKVPQLISHYSDLGSKRARELTSEFLLGIHAFGKTLGPVFLQVSERYTPVRKAQFMSYVKDWPKDVRLFAEVRHPEWFSDAETREFLFAGLHANKVGAVITDTSARRDCVHMELTVPETMVRFVGNGLHRTDFERIDAWVERLDSWFKKGLQEVYFFMHQHDEIDTLELCAYFIEKINSVCGLEVEPPHFISKTGSLFD